MAIVEEPQQHRLSRTEISKLAHKYWRLVLIVFLSGTVAMWLSFFVFFTDLYESKTTLLVKVGRENADTPGTVQHGQLVSQGVRAADINSEVEMLSSRSLVEEVVDRLGPDAFKSVLPTPTEWYGYPKYWLKRAARGVKQAYKEFLILTALQKRLTQRQDAIMRVSGGVKVEPVRDSDVLVLKVSMPSPQLSVAVSNALLDAYMKRRSAARQTPAGSDFFAARLSETVVLLSQAEAERAAVRAKWHLSAATEQQTQDLTQLGSIQGELIANRAEIAKLSEQRRLMLERSRALPDLVRKEQVDAANPSIQSIKERITSLEMERAKMSSRYQANSESMVKLNSELADLYSALKNEPSSILGTVTAEANPSKRGFEVSAEQLAVQIAGLERRNEALRAPEARLSARLSDLTAGIDELEAADREFNRIEQDYLLYSKRLEESRMSDELDARSVTNVAIIAPPEMPIAPASPKKMFIMGIAMAVSVLLGLALAALIETTEDRVLDAGNIIEMENINYIGTVKASFG